MKTVKAIDERIQITLKQLMRLKHDAHGFSFLSNQPLKSKLMGLQLHPLYEHLFQAHNAFLFDLPYPIMCRQYHELQLTTQESNCPLLYSAYKST